MYALNTPADVSVSLPPMADRIAGAGRSPVRDLLALTANPNIISFAGGLPAPELFDIAGLRASFAAALQDVPALQYSTTEGNPALRNFIAGRYTAQGLPTMGADILITTGSQQALFLLAQSLLNPGDVVFVERPSYLAALQAFGMAGARIVSVPMDDGGLDLEALDALAAEHRPKLLYTVPTFQNPTGGTMDLPGRESLVRLAAVHGFRIIEDEPYRELRYSGTALPYIASLDAQRVITVGSLSKVLAPGLRVGWVRTPSDVVDALVVAKQSADLHTSTVDQAAAAHYLLGGGLDPALERICSAYRERRDAMLAELPVTLPPGSTWNVPNGGMFVWATLPEGYDSNKLMHRAIEKSVAFVPGAPFYSGNPDRRTLRMSFTTYAPDTIREGLARLGTALNP